jgi:chaperonin GroES
MVLLKPSAKEEVSKGGIVIPDTAQEKSNEGDVIAVGPGRMSKDGTREKLDVKVGDVVIYPKFGGTEYKIAGEDYVILPENAILAKKISK